MPNADEISLLIKQKSAELGFHACGITEALPVSDEMKEYFKRWIADGKHGAMSYMARNMDKRTDPTKLVEGCKSIISLAYNYFPSEYVPQISYYAQGKDYHRIIKDKLFLLLEYINKLHPVKGRVFCDSAPVLERYWAVKAGIGWCGKNRQLIIPGAGTYFFLAEIFVDIELEYDVPYEKKHCGTCRECINNCPAGALSEKGLDARRCLSYLTIEYRGELPAETGKQLENSFYGCDKCQKSCPWNRFATPNNEKQFMPRKELQEMQPEDWNKLTKEQFEQLFENSAIQRCGYEQLMRNIKAVTQSSSAQ